MVGCCEADKQIDVSVSSNAEVILPWLQLTEYNGLQAYRGCSGDLDFEMVLNRMDSAFLQSPSDGQLTPSDFCTSCLCSHFTCYSHIHNVVTCQHFKPHFKYPCYLFQHTSLSMQVLSLTCRQQLAPAGICFQQAQIALTSRPSACCRHPSSTQMFNRHLA